MENRKFIIFLSITLFAGLLLSPAFIFAYSADTTHRALTQEVVKLFNYYYPELEFSEDEANIIIQGGKDEDLEGRWMQHFYDPIYENGLDYGINWQSSKEWAEDTISQSEMDPRYEDALSSVFMSYFGARTDHSWERAIYEYAHGDKERGLYSLGHILHLIEDSSVPDHTRNDPHPGFAKKLQEEFPSLATETIVRLLESSNSTDGSPYESYTSQFGLDSLNISDSIIRQNVQPFLLDTIGEYFDDTAKYSNNNFFSKDTIFDEGYKGPTIVFEKNEILSDDNKYLFGYRNYGLVEYRLVGAYFQSDWRNIIDDKKYFLDDPDNLILSDYWNLLSKKAVQNGAGVVKLFFDEVEKERQSQVLLAKNRSVFGQAIDGLASIFFGGSDDSTDILDQSATVIGVSNMDDGGLTDLRGPSEEVGVGEVLEIAEPLEEPLLEDQRVSLEGLQAVLDGAEDSLAEMEKDLASAVSEIPESSTSDAEQEKFTPSLPYPGFGGGGDFVPSVATANPVPAPSIPPTPPVDTTPPQTIFSILECDDSLSQDGCLITATTLNLSWSSSDNDLDYFELEYGNTISTTTSTSTILMLSDDTLYTFNLRARDTIGNWSDAKTIIVEISTSPIIINEIAWMGTSGSWGDEWIELYNKTTYDIPLNSSWVLYSKTDEKPYIPLSRSIPAKGYYLIERMNDNTISDIIADLVVSFGFGLGYGLSNSGEVLALTYASTTIDETILTTPQKQWPGGDNGQRRTMERIDPYISGDDLSNWGTNIWIIRNGKDVNSNSISGTPKARNSVNYLITNGSSLNTDKTLTKNNSPYVVNNTTLNIPSGVVLTIEPGVVIKFYNSARLNIEGVIKAEGAETDKIVFTSFADDEYGGDTNGDATSTLPTLGSWYGVRINFGDSGSIFDHALFRYGGKYYTPTSSTDRTIVKIQDTDGIIIRNSTFEYSKAHGLVLVNSTSIIENNKFQYNDNWSEAGIGLYITGSGGSYIVKDNTFLQNQTGLNISNVQSSVISQNKFIGNAQYAIISYGAPSEFTGNAASQNGINGILLKGALTTIGGTSTLKADNIPYVIKRNSPSVVANSTLVIESGVVLKGSGAGINIYGDLVIDGNNSGDVIFTSIYDDSVMGDTTGDATSSQAIPGNWRGINVLSSGSIKAKGFTMKYAGMVMYGGHDLGGITVDGANADISNAIFDSNYPHGMFVLNSNSTKIQDTTFQNHTYNGFAGIKAALAVYNSTTTLSNVTFSNNLLGIASDSISIFIASAIDFINNTATTTPSNLFP